MEKKEMTQTQKTELSYIQANSLSNVLATVNKLNSDYPDNPILKDDIVQIMKNGEDYILLYYK
nr:MAG TPA: hypothetical protein [Crassvirales sp.]